MRAKLDGFLKQKDKQIVLRRRCKVALIAVKPVEISTDRGRQREYWVSDMQPHRVLEEMHNIFVKIVVSTERTPSTIVSIARLNFRTQLCILSAITIEESMSCRMSSKGEMVWRKEAEEDAVSVVDN